LKIILIQPNYPSIVRKVLGEVAHPLGLGYIASVIRDEHDVIILDALNLDYTDEEVTDDIKKFDPDAIGITATTPAIYEAYNVAKIAKTINPDITTIIGGAHATFMAREVLEECPYLDIVVRGEGEETIQEVLHILEKKKDLSKISGITYRQNGKIIETEDRPLIKDLDTIPFPSYDLLPKLESNGVKYGVMMTSRGCPFKCTFCSSSLLGQKRWRGRSADNVVEEIQFLESRGIKEIEFLDDTFTLNSQRVIDICDRIKEEKIDLSWSCSSRVNTIDKEMAEKMKEVRCHTIFFGVESGTDWVLKSIGKGISLKDAERSVQITKDLNMNSICSFILGMPGENIDTINNTVNFAIKLDPTFAQFSIATPYPGTELFDMAVKEGYLLTKDWTRYTGTDPVMKILDISTEKLKEMFTRAYLKFYLRPSKILEQLKAKRFFIIKNAVSSAIDYLRSLNKKYNIDNTIN
jgi:radical SAM superfamily enzyme YgiQ (UPF0313 family)